MGVDSGVHVLECLVQRGQRISARDHRVERQLLLQVEIDQERKVTLRTAGAVERIDVGLIPLEELHIHGDHLFYSADADSSTGAAHHGERRVAKLGNGGALEGVVGTTPSIAPLHLLGDIK